MQESIEAEGTEERVLALRTEMCEKSGVTSMEEGHDVENDVAEETMSAVVKLTKANSCPCRVEQKTVSEAALECRESALLCCSTERAVVRMERSAIVTCCSAWACSRSVANGI